VESSGHDHRSVLTLEIEKRVVEGLDNAYADVVWISVDGRRLHPIDGEEYVGQPPVELPADPNFVAPSSDAHEVILGRCTCGEPGCGSVTARVYFLDASTVAWDSLQEGDRASS
jgi:hypothetical protein